MRIKLDVSEDTYRLLCDMLGDRVQDYYDDPFGCVSPCKGAEALAEIRVDLETLKQAAEEMGLVFEHVTRFLISSPFEKERIRQICDGTYGPGRCGISHEIA